MENTVTTNDLCFTCGANRQDLAAAIKNPKIKLEAYWTWSNPYWKASASIEKCPDCLGWAKSTFWKPTP